MLPGRRVWSALNFAVILVLLGVLFIMANFIASRRYARWDVTTQQITRLSDRSRQLLAALKEPVSVIVFYQPAHRLYELVHDQLEEYQQASGLIKVEYIDPYQDAARAGQLVKELELQVTSEADLNLVIFKVGPRQKHVSDTDLAEYDYSTMSFGAEPRVKAFKGEEAFTSAILSVTQAQAPLVWFTGGHGEKSIDSTEPMGLAGLKKYLEQQNMSVQPITLLERTEIPSTTKLLVIAGPNRRFTESELILMERYLEQGGRLLALLDPLEDTGLDGLLAKWGVQLGTDIVVDPEQQLPGVSAANLFVTTYSEHPIVKKMKMLLTLFPLARSVRPFQPLPSGVTATPLALTSKSGWGETKTAVEAFAFDPKEDVQGPVSIAAAAERLAPARTRLVVIGDSDFIVNAQLANVGNRDFLLGAAYWLIEQEQLIGIGPKPLPSLKLNLTASQMSRLFWPSFLGMPLALGLVGLGVWWIRRQ